MPPSAGLHWRCALLGCLAQCRRTPYPVPCLSVVLLSTLRHQVWTTPCPLALVVQFTVAQDTHWCHAVSVFTAFSPNRIGEPYTSEVEHCLYQ